MASSDVKALMNQAEELYFRILKLLIKEHVLPTSTHILVVCGGLTDRDTLMRAGLTKCVISNFDSRQKANEFLPLEWSYQDAEAMSYPDEAFDFCIVHEGLHHCQSQHTAMKEMFSTYINKSLPNLAANLKLRQRWRVGGRCGVP